jgi:cytoskeletal protein CcmA (bactofilin family)
VSPQKNGDRCEFSARSPLSPIVFVACLLFAGPAAASEYDKVNGSIEVPEGQKVGAVSTVNGSITVGDGAAVTSASTVNGHIALGARATAASLKTVNGEITLARGAEVAGPVANVNGSIRLDAAHVAGGIRTTTGDIDVGTGSRVEGGITVERGSTGWFSIQFGSQRIVIGPEAVVQGTLRFEREVKLYVSERATVGPIEGATPIRFAGEKP